MSLTAILFLSVVTTGYISGCFKKPFYALLTYIFVYFICPNPAINWWAGEIPQLRWSFLSAFILLIAVGLHSRELNDIKFKDIKTGWWLIAFLLLSIIISFYAVSPERSFDRCYDFARYIVIFYLMIKCIKTEKELLILVVLFLLLGFMLGYFALGHPRYAGRLEGIGTPDTANANGLALLLATLLPFGLPVFFTGKKILKCCTVIFLIFILNGIVLCNSRGAIVSLGASMFCLLLLSKSFSRLRWKVLIVTVLIGCSLVYLADDQFVRRFTSISESSSTDRGSGRLDIWKNGIRMVRDYPLGAGGGGFQTLSPFYMDKQQLTFGGVRSSHNTYLLILVEQGFVGLLVYLFFYMQLFNDLSASRKLLLPLIINNKTSYMQNDCTFLYGLNIALTSSLTGHMVGAFFGNRLYYEFVYYLAALSVLIKYFSMKAVSANLYGKEDVSSASTISVMHSFINNKM